MEIQQETSKTTDVQNKGGANDIETKLNHVKQKKSARFLSIISPIS